jgi:hypothetical protein
MTLDTIKPSGETPEEKAKNLEALKQERKKLLLDSLFSNDLRLQRAFSSRKITENHLTGIQSDEERNEVKKELDALLLFLLSKNVIKRTASSSFIVGTAMHEFPFNEESKVDDAKKSLLKGEEIKKPAAAAPAVPTGAPAAPTNNNVPSSELSSRINANEADVLADAPVNPDDIDFDVAAAKGNGAFAFWIEQYKQF